MLEDAARVAWAAETGVQSVLRAPTLESMLLRMEQIQVRAAHRGSSAGEKVTEGPERSHLICLLFAADP